MIRPIRAVVLMVLVGLTPTGCDGDDEHRGPEGWIQVPCKPPIGTPDQDCYIPPSQAGDDK